MILHRHRSSVNYWPNGTLKISVRPMTEQNIQPREALSRAG